MLTKVKAALEDLKPADLTYEEIDHYPGGSRLADCHGFILRHRDDPTPSVRLLYWLDNTAEWDLILTQNGDQTTRTIKTIPADDFAIILVRHAYRLLDQMIHM